MAMEIQIPGTDLRFTDQPPRTILASCDGCTNELTPVYLTGIASCCGNCERILCMGCVSKILDMQAELAVALAAGGKRV